jgi:hypothetical protein
MNDQSKKKYQRKYDNLIERVCYVCLASRTPLPGVEPVFTTMGEAGNDEGIIKELETQFLGSAQIMLSSLIFHEEDTQFEVSTDRVNALVSIFKTDGCERTKKQNHISAFIDKYIYCRLKHKKHEFLNLPIPIICLNGRHRIAAAKLYFLPENQWWSVSLYSEGMFEKNNMVSDTNNNTARNYQGNTGLSQG